MFSHTQISLETDTNLENKSSQPVMIGTTSPLVNARFLGFQSLQSGRFIKRIYSQAGQVIELWDVSDLINPVVKKTEGFGLFNTHEGTLPKGDKVHHHKKNLTTTSLSTVAKEIKISKTDLMLQSNALNKQELKRLNENYLYKKVFELIPVSDEKILIIHKLCNDYVNKTYSDVFIQLVNLSRKKITEELDLTFRNRQYGNMMYRASFPDGRTFFCVLENFTNHYKFAAIFDAETMQFYATNIKFEDGLAPYGYFQFAAKKPKVLVGGEVVFFDLFALQVYEFPHVKAFFKNGLKRELELLPFLCNDVAQIVADYVGSDFRSVSWLNKLSQKEKLSLAANPASFYGKPLIKSTACEPGSVSRFRFITG